MICRKETKIENNLYYWTCHEIWAQECFGYTDLHVMMTYREKISHQDWIVDLILCPVDNKSPGELG